MSKHRKRNRTRNNITGNSHQRRVSRRFNKHHIVNKCNRGPATEENLLVWDIDKHNAWHKIFKNKSFLEVIQLLVRCLKMKNHPDYPRAKEELESL